MFTIIAINNFTGIFQPLLNNVVSVLGVAFSTNIPLEDFCRSVGYELELTPFGKTLYFIVSLHAFCIIHFLFLDPSKFEREQFKVSYLNETCKVCLKDLTGCAKIQFFDDFGDVSKEIMNISAALRSMDVQVRLFTWN